VTRILDQVKVQAQCRTVDTSYLKEKGRIKESGGDVRGAAHGAGN